MQPVRRQILRYGLGIVAAVIALALRKLLEPLLGNENPYHTAWAAVVFAAWYCGIGPAVVTVVITLLGVDYWFLPPYGSFSVYNKQELFGAMGFLILCAAIIALTESTRGLMVKRQLVEDELRKAHEELEIRVRERTASLAEKTASLEQKTNELLEQAQMLDQANDAIFVRTVADTISYWNEGAERVYGWTKEEAIGRSAHDLLHTEFPIPFDEIKTKDTWEGELRHTKRDGSKIIVASRWRALRDPLGNTTGWLEINTDITSRKRAEEAARALSARILSLQDNERRRIARGLHDSLGQYLVALKMNLDRMQASAPEQEQLVSESSDIVNRCLAETRTVSHLLHPPLLDESGLVSAVRLYVDEFSRRSGIAADFQASPERMRLPSETEIALFRAIQEGLTNVHRHSGASSVEIRLTLDEKRVRLEIRDNGKGIPQDRLHRVTEGAPEVGVGLAGMRERLREMNGSLEIQSDASGTTLLITAPAPSNMTMEPDALIA